MARAFAVAFEDDATVCYKPLFDSAGRHLHLVVLEPRIGVIVPEVLKGKDRSSLLGVPFVARPASSRTSHRRRLTTIGRQLPLTRHLSVLGNRVMAPAGRHRTTRR